MKIFKLFILINLFLLSSKSIFANNNCDDMFGNCPGTFLEITDSERFGDSATITIYTDYKNVTCTIFNKENKPIGSGQTGEYFIKGNVGKVWVEFPLKYQNDKNLTYGCEGHNK